MGDFNNSPSQQYICRKLSHLKAKQLFVCYQKEWIGKLLWIYYCKYILLWIPYCAVDLQYTILRSPQNADHLVLANASAKVCWWKYVWRGWKKLAGEYFLGESEKKFVGEIFFGEGKGSAALQCCAAVVWWFLVQRSALVVQLMPNKLHFWSNSSAQYLEADSTLHRAIALWPWSGIDKAMLTLPSNV